MYASIQVIGNVGNFELKETNDKKFARFSVATSSWSKEGGKKTTWYNVVCWNGKLSEFLSGKVAKGSKVFVTGELQQREYTDKNGVTKTSTDVVVSPFNGTIIILSDWAEGSAADTPDDSDIPF